MPQGMDRGKIAELARDFGELSPELRRTLRPELRKTATPIVADAKRRASWSTRIPGAIKLQTRLTGKNPGVQIVVSAKKAPHARPYENLGDRGTFRHPVFGNRDVWVEQRARPFLFPAADAGRAGVVSATGDAVDKAARLHGFRG